MEKIVIDSRVSLGNKVYVEFTQDQIKNEPMLFSCDLNHAIKLGGALTKAFLDNLDKEFLADPTFIIDSRVHMLMPGWWPCIPGYHHDDVLRTRDDGQPFYERIRDIGYALSRHAMIIIGDSSRTQFALGQEEFPIIPKGGIVYKEWHPLVERMVGDGRLISYMAEPDRVIYFDWQTWHQGTVATKNGWRFFARVTINTTRKPSNELRRQVQVYLERPMEGW